MKGKCNAESMKGDGCTAGQASAQYYQSKQSVPIRRGNKAPTEASQKKDVHTEHPPILLFGRKVRLLNHQQC